MLTEVKNSYKEYADQIEDWKSQSKSQLCNCYLRLKENEDPLAENYLSAIILRFWQSIKKNYHQQWSCIASEEECYNWLIDSILQALRQKVWMDPNSSLYNDPQAPEKCINVILNSIKINYFVAQKRDKRLSSLWSRSLDELKEQGLDGYHFSYFDDYSVLEEHINQLIRHYFQNKEYFKSFCLFCISTFDFFKQENHEGKSYSVFDCFAVKKFLRYLTQPDLSMFSHICNVDISETKKAYEYVRNLSYDRMNRSLDSFLLELKRNKKLVEELKYK